jgi:serine/threonine protein kinase
MNHPLVVQIRESCSGANNQNPSIVTDFVGNGSLADHLPGAENGDLCQLSDSTRIMRIITGIALAMRFIHSRGIIHRNLMPDNILLDWDWNVRICDFARSVSTNQPKHCEITNPSGVVFWSDVISRFAAPETYDNINVPENDVFSFGMILYELIVGRPVFPKDMDPYQVMLAMAQGKWRLDIPETVIPVTVELIQGCLALDYRHRPLFSEILQRLEAIDFKLMAGVNSVEIGAFMTEIEEYELRTQSHNHPVDDNQ